MSELTREEIEEIVSTAVEEETAELQSRVSELEKQNEQLQKENAELRGRVHDLERENEAFAHVYERLKQADRNAGRRIAELSARVYEVEEALDSVDATVGDGNGDLTTEDLTPMEQIARLPEHVAADQFDTADHRNTYRARQVVRDWTDYSSNTPKGRLIWNADLCRVLTALGDGGKTESTTGRRVMDRIETLSKGAFERRKRKGSHVLVLENPERLGDPASMGASDAVVT